MSFRGSGNRLLPNQFALPVNAGRGRWRILGIRHTRRPVKHEICRVVHKYRIDFLARGSHHQRRVGIDRVGQGRFRLCAVHGSVGRGIDNDRGSRRQHDFPQTGRSGQINIGLIQKLRFVAPRQNFCQRRSQLTNTTDDQDFHGPGSGTQFRQFR